MIFGRFTDVRMRHFALVFKSRMFFRIEEEEFVWIFFEFQNLIQIFSEFQNSKLKNFTFEFWISKNFKFVLNLKNWISIFFERRRSRQPLARSAQAPKLHIPAPKALARGAARANRFAGEAANPSAEGVGAKRRKAAHPLTQSARRRRAGHRLVTY